MDASIINPFVEATMEVTRTMANMESSVGKPKLKDGTNAPGSITGFINLSSNTHNGSLALSFEESTILTVYERMLGEKQDTIDDSVLDLAGEITNMVCGGAKQRLSLSGFDFNLTSPSILSGDNHQIKHSGSGPVLTLPLQFEEGQMHIEVYLGR